MAEPRRRTSALRKGITRKTVAAVRTVGAFTAPARGRGPFRANVRLDASSVDDRRANRAWQGIPRREGAWGRSKARRTTSFRRDATTPASMFRQDTRRKSGPPNAPGMNRTGQSRKRFRIR